LEVPVPELPEVETVVRGLRDALVNKRITSVASSRKRLRRPWAVGWHKKLLRRTITEVDRRGKWIIVALDDGSRLLIHLGMTGQLLIQPARFQVQPHTHFTLGLNRGKEQLRFRDVRRFGSAAFFPDLDAMRLFFQESGLGPEPFELDRHYWFEALSRARRSLKAILLDQRVLAGVGNIYADEALFEAKLHPARIGAGVTPQEAERLRRALVKVLDRAITCRGSSIRDYLGVSGDRGEYQDEFRVYGRAGQPCPRCGTPIKRLRLAGRSTHFCRDCQALGSRHRQTSRNVELRTLNFKPKIQVRSSQIQRGVEDSI
jgi:formamidopyrimidine-DNA glycosylase